MQKLQSIVHSILNVKLSRRIIDIKDKIIIVNFRGGVLDDVLGLEDVLEDTFWSPWPWPRRSSPWPWPRGLKSSQIGLSSARGQHYFLNCKILWSAWKIFWKTFFCGGQPEKFLWRPFLFLESSCACVLGPWPRAFLSLASSIPVLGLVSVCPRKGCPWPWPRIFFVSLALASSLASSTPPLVNVLRELYGFEFTPPRSRYQLIAIILRTFYIPNCLDQETAKRHFGLRSEPSCHQPKCLALMVEASQCPFNCWTSSKETWIPIYIVIGLTRPGIEPKTTVLVADIHWNADHLINSKLNKSL